tara:strand:+ start:146 stop:946 length:801 start_codon:yes stop_codon:yes gene_type:complete
MAFKMNGSPAKMGTISGTAGHSSALKMKAEADAASALKQVDPYAKALKKDPKLGEYVKTRSSSEKGSAEHDSAQNKINVAYGNKTRHGATSSTETKGKTKTTTSNVPGVSTSSASTKTTRGGKKKVTKKSYEDDQGITTRKIKTITDKEGGLKRSKKVIKSDYDKDGTDDKKTKIKTNAKKGTTKRVTKEGGRRTVTKTDKKGNVTTKSRRTLKGFLTGKGKGKRTKTTKYANTDAGYKENEKPGGENYMDDFKKPMEKGYKSLTD